MVVAKTGTALLVESTRMTVDWSEVYYVCYTASDLATAVMLGVKSTDDDVTIVSIECSPFSVEATMLNTFEIEASSDSTVYWGVLSDFVKRVEDIDCESMCTASDMVTEDVGCIALEYHGRVASAKGGYGAVDVSDSSHVDGTVIRTYGACADNLNMYGIGRMSLLVTVLNSVKGEVSFDVTCYVKDHSIGVSGV